MKITSLSSCSVFKLEIVYCEFSIDVALEEKKCHNAYIQMALDSYI